MTPKDCNEAHKTDAENVEMLKTILRGRLSDERQQNAAQQNTQNANFTWREFIPVYIALGSLLVSTFITYADMKTQVATLEVKVSILSQTLSELKVELRNGRQPQERQQ